MTLTATPDTGWEFVGWSGDLAGSDNPATVTIESDTTIEALFVEQIEVTLTTSTDGSGSVTVDPQQATYLAGDSVTVTATPDTGWRFTGWTGGLTGTANPTTTTLTNNTTITATFQPLPDGPFALATGVVGSGSLAANPDQTTFAAGELVTLTATPDPGWQLGSWEMSPPLLDDWWDTQWDYRTSVDVSADAVERSNALARVEVDFTATLSSLGVSGTFDTSSLRVVEVDDSGASIDASVAFQFDQTADFDATTNASGTLWILVAGQTAAGQTRSFDVYFDTVGKGLAAASVTPRIDVADGVVREGLNTVRISNDSGTFFYDKDGGGFSSLLDTDGNDWISWNAATGAAGEFRGVPNLVFPGGLMHPGLGGVATTIVDSGPLVATLRSTSLDGQWTTEWRIGPERAELTVVEAPGDYWFLYEGTPGGSLETNSDTVTRPDGTVTTAGTSVDRRSPRRRVGGLRRPWCRPVAVRGEPRARPVRRLVPCDGRRDDGVRFRTPEHELVSLRGGPFVLDRPHRGNGSIAGRRTGDGRHPAADGGRHRRPEHIRDDRRHQSPELPDVRRSVGHRSVRARPCQRPSTSRSSVTVSFRWHRTRPRIPRASR